MLEMGRGLRKHLEKKKKMAKTAKNSNSSMTYYQLSPKNLRVF